MSNETVRTPKPGETWRHKRYHNHWLDFRYVDDSGAYGPDEVGRAEALSPRSYGKWEPVPPPRPSVDFTRWVYPGGYSGVVRHGNAPGVHVWSDDDGNLHADWIDEDQS